MIALLAVLAVNNSANAQAKINSPYSRIGLGDFSFTEMNYIKAMGGLSGAYNSSYNYSLQNPASLGFLQTTSFDVGLGTRYSSYDDSGKNVNLWSGNLEYFSLGFTLKNPINEALGETSISKFSWGSSISLIPVSQIGYNISSVDEDDNIGSVGRFYEGNGGLNALRWGVGARYGEFSLGLNLDFMFGQLSTEREVRLSDLPGSFVDRVSTDYSVRGVTPGFGAQYRWVLEKNNDEINTKNRKILTFGVYGKFPTKFKVTADSIHLRYNTVYSIHDTISSSLNVESKNNKLPLEIGFGIMYENVGKTRLGINMTYGQWADFSSDIMSSNYDNSFGISLGGEIIPKIDAFGDYMKTVRYRGSLNYRQDPKVFAGSQLTDMSVHVGAGFPIYVNRQLSMLNLGFEYGVFGQNMSLTERYFKINFAFSLSDNMWFFKRRFN